MTSFDAGMILTIIAALREIASAAHTAISEGIASVSTPQWMFASAGAAFVAYLLYLSAAIATQA